MKILKILYPVKILLLLLFLLFLFSCHDNGLYISLEGEWEYKKDFDATWLSDYTPHHWEKINLPFYFKSIVDSKEFRGFITLRKELPGRIIDLLKIGKNISFRSGKISQPADLYFNTTLLGTLKTSGPSKDTIGDELIKHLPQPDPTQNGMNAIFIVIHITGTSNLPCIIGHNIEVGESNRIYSRIYSNIITTILFICFYMIIGSYFIHMGIRIRNKLFCLYFGLYCVFFSLFNFINYPAHQLRIITNHILRYRLIHTTIFLTGPAFIYFFYHFYKKNIPIVLQIWTGLCIVSGLITFFIPAFVINIFSFIWYLSWIIVLMYLLTIIIIDITINNSETLLIITGLGILIFSIIYDLLVSSGFIPPPPIELYTSFITILIISIVIVNRFVRTHRKVEQLNRELEIRMKERTKKLEQAQTKLIDTAHKAGMAEVATSILHNMRNILTSMSIACEEIMETLEESKIAGLVKANDLLQKHKNEINTFLSENLKGKLLIDYYLNIEEMLKKEHDKIILETEQLVKNTIIIKKIIDTQQEYAKRELVDNELNLRDTIEEALRIQSSEFIKASVKIKKQYIDIPKIRGLKSSVIQIMLNIFKNALTAMQQNEPWNRILTIETGKENGKNIFIKISDNGIGIRIEDLKKIFSFGFTNQKDGHGFGLHACADIINKMGGTITAESSGPGKGSSFILLFFIKK